MTSKTKTRSFRLSPATAISCLALFLALTGSAFAVGVAKNSVRSAQIVDGTVRSVDLRESAVKAAQVAPDAIGAEEIAESAVASPEVAPDSLSAADLAPNSVAASELGSVVQRQSAAKAIAAGANGSVSIGCEPGEQLLSGGGQPGVFGVEMTSSRPEGNAWLYQARNNSGSASTITAFALCLAN